MRNDGVGEREVGPAGPAVVDVAGQAAEGVGEVIDEGGVGERLGFGGRVGGVVDREPVVAGPAVEGDRPEELSVDVAVAEREAIDAVAGVDGERRARAEAADADGVVARAGVDDKRAGPVVERLVGGRAGDGAGVDGPICRARERAIVDVDGGAGHERVRRGQAPERAVPHVDDAAAVRAAGDREAIYKAVDGVDADDGRHVELS